MQTFEDFQPYARKIAQSILGPNRKALGYEHEDVNATADLFLAQCFKEYQTPNKGTVAATVRNGVLNIIRDGEKFAQADPPVQTVAPVPEIFYDVKRITDVQALVAFSMGIPVRRIKGFTAYKLRLIKRQVDQKVSA